MARVYVGLDDKQAAHNWIEKAYRTAAHTGDLSSRMDATERHDVADLRPSTRWRPQPGLPRRRAPLCRPIGWGGGASVLIVTNSIRGRGASRHSFPPTS